MKILLPLLLLVGCSDFKLDKKILLHKAKRACSCSNDTVRMIQFYPEDKSADVLCTKGTKGTINLNTLFLCAD